MQTYFVQNGRIREERKEMDAGDRDSIAKEERGEVVAKIGASEPKGKQDLTMLDILFSPPMLDLLKFQLETTMASPDHIKQAIDYGLIEVIDEPDPDINC
jgi:hypothetical protein